MLTKGSPGLNSRFGNEAAIPNGTAESGGFEAPGALTAVNRSAAAGEPLKNVAVQQNGC